MSLPAHPDLPPLFPDARDIERAWSRRRGLVPVHHVLVVKEELAAAHPWLKDELFRLFQDARQAAGAEPAGDGLPGRGVEANRAALETVARYAHEQGITPCVFAVEEMFRP